MNFYEHHLGDYAQATAHLNFIEDAAYSRLIRKYYAEEKPLPVEIKAVQRLIGARSEEERDAVEVILNEFFVLSDDGWHNKRCDEDISAYRDKQAKAKRSAEARWSNPELQCDQTANEMRANNERNANALKTECSPVASLQSPVSSSKSKSLSAPASRLPPDWNPTDDEILFCKTERSDLNPSVVAARFRDYWLAVPGVKGRKQDWAATWRNWVRNEKTQQPRASPTFAQQRDIERSNVVAVLTGRTKLEPVVEREILGESFRVAN